MTDPLSDLFAREPVVVADGALGISLFALGLETGASPELWNLEQPERVRSVHQSFVDAGSDLILINSFGGNRFRLSLHGAQAQVGALNRAAARVARAVADAADRPVLVAGSIGPTGEIFAPIGTLDRQAGEAAFAEQAEALADGGCDVLWIETISAVEELEAAVAGAARTGLPVVATMTFDTRGRTMMGVTTEAAMHLRERLVVRPVAFGVPHYHEGRIHYDGTPEIMAAYACLARDAGARVIGGCCGTTAGHIRAMVLALASRPPGPRQERATVEAALGPLTAPPAGEATRRVRRPRRRGERA